MFFGRRRSRKHWRLGSADMQELLNPQKEWTKSRTQWHKECVLFAGVSLTVLVGVILALVFSGDSYWGLEIALIVAGTLYIWWALYYLTVVLKVRRKELRFYQSAIGGLKETQELTVVDYCPALTYSKDGLEARLLKTTFPERGQTYERDLYVLVGDPSFPQGSRIRAVSFGNVLLAYEVVA